MSQEFHNFPMSPDNEANAIADVQLASEDLPGEHDLSLRERAGKLIEGYHAWAEKYPFAATAVETAVVFAAKKAAAYAGDQIGLNVRNALAEDHLETARKHAGVVKPAENWTKPPFIKVSTENVSVPLVPLMGGLNYQRLSRKRGFGHAVLGHSINNALEGIQAVPEVRRRRK